MHSYNFWQSLILVLYFSWNSLLALAPYIIGGVITGEALRLTSWTKLIFKGVSRSPFISILAAALLGVLSPLCTYGTVPVVLQLSRSGISVAPLITFLSASAMMNPQLFILTWGGLGPEIAMIRLAAVLGFSLLLGYGLFKIPSAWLLNPGVTGISNEVTEKAKDSPQKISLGQFVKNVFNTLSYVGFYVLVGVILSAVLDVFVAKEWLQTLLTGNDFITLLGAAIMGVPLSACGGGAIPVVKELMSSGMRKGLALTFLFAGPATRITPLLSLASIIRPVFIVLYIIVVIIFAIFIGFIFR